MSQCLGLLTSLETSAGLLRHNLAMNDLKGPRKNIECYKWYNGADIFAGSPVAQQI
jgi:hypothetical protein